MSYRSVELAGAQLGKYFDDFEGAVNDGTRHFWTAYADDAYRITSVARANLVRCFIADELKKRLDGRPGINIKEPPQTMLIGFGQDWILKVHKTDETGHIAPNDTQTRMDLNDNDLNSLPGIPASATVVYLGYIERIADRLNPEIRLVCPDGERPAWIIEIRGSELSPPSPPEIIPIGGDDGGTKVVVRRQERKTSH